MKIKSIFTGMIVAAFAFFAIPAEAQFQQPQQQEAPEIEVSDDELELFLEASFSAQEIQTESQQQMVEIVDDEGLDVETYNEIMRSEQTGESADVSSDDKEKFENASEQIREIEQDMEAEITEAIEEEGMEMSRFQEINMGIRQDPELQQRVQQMIQEMQPQQPQQPQPPQQP